jgi:hypothetical protein
MKIRWTENALSGRKAPEFATEDIREVTFNDR